MRWLSVPIPHRSVSRPWLNVGNSSQQGFSLSRMPIVVTLSPLCSRASTERQGAISFRPS
jgi:hypothetical protein